MKRIVTIGPWGSGKSQLASALVRVPGVPHVEQEPLYWTSGWIPTPVDEFRGSVAAATAGDAWVADGNFTSAREIVWAWADTLEWLDYGFPLVFWRLARRQIRGVVIRTSAEPRRPPVTSS